MSIVVLLVIVAVIGAVVVVLAGRTGGAADFEPDRPNFVLPAEALRSGDVDAVRFAVGVRGYRMDQVDLVMDRLSEELDGRDREIAELKGEPWPSAQPVDAADGSTVGGAPPEETTAEAGADAAEDLVDRG